MSKPFQIFFYFFVALFFLNQAETLLSMPQKKNKGEVGAQKKGRVCDHCKNKKCFDAALNLRTKSFQEIKELALCEIQSGHLCPAFHNHILTNIIEHGGYKTFSDLLELYNVELRGAIIRYPKAQGQSTLLEHVLEKQLPSSLIKKLINFGANINSAKALNYAAANFKNLKECKEQSLNDSCDLQYFDKFNTLVLLVTNKNQTKLEDIHPGTNKTYAVTISELHVDLKRLVLGHSNFSLKWDPDEDFLTMSHPEEKLYLESFKANAKDITLEHLLSVIFSGNLTQTKKIFEHRPDLFQIEPNKILERAQSLVADRIHFSHITGADDSVIKHAEELETLVKELVKATPLVAKEVVAKEGTERSTVVQDESFLRKKIAFMENMQRRLKENNESTEDPLFIEISCPHCKEPSCSARLRAMTTKSLSKSSLKKTIRDLQQDAKKDTPCLFFHWISIRELVEQKAFDEIITLLKGYSVTFRKAVINFENCCDDCKNFWDKGYTVSLLFAAIIANADFSFINSLIEFGADVTSEDISKVALNGYMLTQDDSYFTLLAVLIAHENQHAIQHYGKVETLSIEHYRILNILDPSVSKSSTDNLDLDLSLANLNTNEIKNKFEKEPELFLKFENGAKYVITLQNKFGMGIIGRLIAKKIDIVGQLLKKCVAEAKKIIHLKEEENTVRARVKADQEREFTGIRREEVAERRSIKNKLETYNKFIQQHQCEIERQLAEHQKQVQSLCDKSKKRLKKIEQPSTRKTVELSKIKKDIEDLILNEEVTREELENEAVEMLEELEAEANYDYILLVRKLKKELCSQENLERDRLEKSADQELLIQLANAKRNHCISLLQTIEREETTQRESTLREMKIAGKKIMANRHALREQEATSKMGITQKQKKSMSKNAYLLLKKAIRRPAKQAKRVRFNDIVSYVEAEPEPTLRPRVLTKKNTRGKIRQLQHSPTTSCLLSFIDEANEFIRDMLPGNSFCSESNPICAALITSHWEMLENFIAQGYSPLDEEYEGLNPLFLTFSTQNNDALERLLFAPSGEPRSYAKQLVNKTRQYNMYNPIIETKQPVDITPLALAIEQANVTAVKLLIKAGASCTGFSIPCFCQKEVVEEESSITIPQHFPPYKDALDLAGAYHNDADDEALQDKYMTIVKILKEVMDPSPAAPDDGEERIFGW